MEAAKFNAQQRREAKIEEILERAGQLLAKDGLGALTLQRIAGELSLTPTALYRYISSKDELVARLQQRSLRQMLVMFDRAWTAWDRSRIVSALDPEPRALVMIMASCRFYGQLRIDRSFHLELMSELMGKSTEIDVRWARQVVPIWRGMLDGVAALLDKAADVGAITPGDSLKRAGLLWASTQGVVQTHKLRRLAPNIYSVHEMTRELAVSMLSGWGAKPGEVSEALAALARMRLRTK